MLKSRLAKICGRAKFFGFADIKPGHVIELQGSRRSLQWEGVCERRAAQYRQWRHGTHTCSSVSVPQWFHQSRRHTGYPAAGLLPAVHGLQIGKVVQLQDDPDGEHRILVRLPIIDNSARGIWARIASLDAGLNRGAFFRPEIDDEVIVGFVNDDPRDAIVLGNAAQQRKTRSDYCQGRQSREGIS